jgi:hypothetical protein
MEASGPGMSKVPPEWEGFLGQCLSSCAAPGNHLLNPLTRFLAWQSEVPHCIISCTLCLRTPPYCRAARKALGCAIRQLVVAVRLHYSPGSTATEPI